MPGWKQVGALVVAGAIFAVLTLEARWLRWTTGALPEATGEPLTIETDPHHSKNLYAGTRKAAVYRSLDGGATWARTWPGGSKPRGGDGSNRIWSEQGKETG